ncbi:hypothetical protein D9M68_811980 [compost metagenome]
MHGVQVQQPIRALYKGLQRRNASTLACVAQFDAIGHPLPVHVFVHEPGSVVIVRVEPVEGLQVAERQCQHAVFRPHTSLQQLLQCPRTTQFVAVHQPAHHDVRTIDARVETPHAFGAGVTCSPWAELGLGQ